MDVRNFLLKCGIEKWHQVNPPLDNQNVGMTTEERPLHSSLSMINGGTSRIGALLPDVCKE